MTTSTASPSPKPPTPREEWVNLLDWFSLKHEGGWWFRGQPNATWGLQPGIGRTPAGRRPYRIQDEQAAFEAFKREAARLIDLHTFEPLEQLAMAQHYGLPTRLLDWTTNPLVAIWFAIDGEKEAAHNGRIHAIRPPASRIAAKATPWGPSPDKVTFVQVSSRISRVTAQQGLFTLHHNPQTAWNAKVDKDLNYATLDVSSRGKPALRRFLHQFGVDRGRLMVDLDGICSTLKWRLEAGDLAGA